MGSGEFKWENEGAISLGDEKVRKNPMGDEEARGKKPMGDKEVRKIKRRGEESVGDEEVRERESE